MFIIRIIREQGIAKYRRTCYNERIIADDISIKQRCLEILSNRCLRSFFRSFANDASQMVSFWCLSLLVCFLSWNAIAEEQDPIAQLKQRCDQLEEKSKWPEAIAVAEKILSLTKEKHGEQHAETVDA